MTNEKNKQIREYLGHGNGTRRVRIHRDGTVNCYGSTDSAGRAQDRWTIAGYADEIWVRMQQERDVDARWSR
jgi:hypothetical protein